MKKLVYFLVTLLSLLFFTVRPFAMAPAAPEAAVAGMLEELRSWDALPVAAALDDALPGGYGEALCEALLLPALSRLDYSMGNAKVTGRNAQVDVSVTAADIKGMVGDIVSEAVGFAAIARLTGLPLDVEAHVTRRVAEMMDETNLTTITTRSTVYLALGGDGEWKVDVTDSRNLDFLTALTGGLVDFTASLDAVKNLSLGS